MLVSSYPLNISRTTTTLIQVRKHTTDISKNIVGLVTLATYVAINNHYVTTTSNNLMVISLHHRFYFEDVSLLVARQSYMR